MNITAFTKIIYAVAIELKGSILQIKEAGVTPNFHAAEIAWSGNAPAFILCSITGHWAFAKPFTQASQNLVFIDSIELFSALSHVGNFRIWITAELNSSFIPTAETSEYDIKYWKPQTVGEGLFNWWD
jgi:hypothetical protein